MDFLFKFLFALLIHSFPCFAVEISRACYGSRGSICTRHNLRCSSGSIAIQEAFYTDSTVCGTGLTTCTVELGSIPLTGTRYNLTDTELDSLYGNCSTRPTCSFQAGRRDALASFSVIRYRCISMTTANAKLSAVSAIASLTSGTPAGSSPVVSPDKTTTTEVTTDAESNTGTVVGIIIPLCIIIAGIVTSVILFRRRKSRHTGGNEKAANVKSTPHDQELEFQKATTGVKGSSDYDYAGGNTYHILEPQSTQKSASDYDYAGANNYHELEPQQGVQRYDYDYARCVQQTNNEHSSSRKPQTHGSDYDHTCIGYKPTNSDGHYATTLSVASMLKESNATEEVYSYDHLNDRKDTSNVIDSTYNTTVATRHRMDASTNKMEDDYGYNHLGVESKKNLPQNEYDTSASALRDIARMNGDMEDST